MAAITSIAENKTSSKSVHFAETPKQETAAKAQTLSPVIAALNAAIEKILAQPRPSFDPWQFQPKQHFGGGRRLPDNYVFSIPAANKLIDEPGKQDIRAIDKCHIMDVPKPQTRLLDPDGKMCLADVDAHCIHVCIVRLDAVAALYQRLMLRNHLFTEAEKVLRDAPASSHSEESAAIEKDLLTLTGCIHHISNELSFYHQFTLGKKKTILENDCANFLWSRGRVSYMWNQVSNWVSGQSISAIDQMRKLCEVPSGTQADTSEKSKPSSKLSPLEVSAPSTVDSKK